MRQLLQSTQKNKSYATHIVILLHSAQAWTFGVRLSQSLFIPEVDPHEL